MATKAKQKAQVSMDARPSFHVKHQPLFYQKGYRMGKLFFQDNLRRLILGDCRSMVELPDNSVHCVVTSPPYFGLRNYQADAQIWGGLLDCAHEWQSAPPRRRRLATDIVDPNSKEATNRGNVGIEPQSTNFCVKCGAWRGQLGCEPTADLYIQHLILVMREIKRVLRPDGVLWLNIGDSWAGGKGQSGSYGADIQAGRNERGESLNTGYQTMGGPLITRNLDDRAALRAAGIKPMDMVLVPQMLALAARADGWHIRSEVIWNKLNTMPESINGWRWEQHRVKLKSQSTTTRGKLTGDRHDGTPSRVLTGLRADYYGDQNTEWQDCPGCKLCSPNDGLVLRRGSWRPTDAHEVIWLLTKTESYYCDKEAVIEPYTAPLDRWGGDNLKANGTSHWDAGTGQDIYRDLNMRPNPAGRNLRSVWTFPTMPYPGGKHFAVFPPKLPELCIKASTSERGCCPQCGAQWARVVKTIPSKFNIRVRDAARGAATPEEGYTATEQEIQDYQQYGNHPPEGATETIGWRPTCSCNAGEPVACTVLDPFAGSGTTLQVAAELSRRAIGYEISEQYCRTVIDRNRQDVFELH